MALTPINYQRKPDHGGGGLGGIIGKVLGGIGGFLVGGPAGAVMGASAGGTLGGGAGSVIDKAKDGGEVELTPFQRRASPATSEAISKPSRVLQDSLSALQTAPDDLRQAYEEPLKKALSMAGRNDYLGRRTA